MNGSKISESWTLKAHLFFMNQERFFELEWHCNMLISLTWTEVFFIFQRKLTLLSEAVTEGRGKWLNLKFETREGLLFHWFCWSQFNRVDLHMIKTQHRCIKLLQYIDACNSFDCSSRGPARPTCWVPGAYHWNPVWKPCCYRLSSCDRLIKATPKT